MSTSLSETQLQRLVDSELSHEERQIFLSEIERTPELWREVALAFVERQVLEQELGSMFQAVVKDPEKSVTKSPSYKRTLWPAALAALLMLSLGFAAGQFFTQQASRGKPAGVVSANNAPRESSDASQPSYRLKLSAMSQTGSPQTIEVPIYEQAQLQRQSPAQQANDALSARGYAVDWDTNYLTGQLQDGRRLIVPVKSPAIHYYGQ